MKEKLYNWSGLNHYIFLKINNFIKLFEVDYVFSFIDILTSYSNFIYHFGFLLILAAVMLYKNKDNKALLADITKYWINFFSIFLSALALSYFFISFFKDFFKYTRPFCTPNMSEIHIIPALIMPLTCTHSFPSGHVTYVVIFAVSAWSYAKGLKKLLLIFLILAASLSRIASGAHFPADILGAIFISTTVTIMIKPVILKLLNRYKKIVTKFTPWVS